MTTVPALSTVQIDARHLVAAMFCAAKQDVRYYFNAIYVEATADETRTTATDGHTCITLRSLPDNGNALVNTPKLAVLIPRDVVERVNKNTRGKGWVSLQATDAGWELVTVFARFPFVPLEAKFPDYRSIFPLKTSGELAQFDFELLMQFKKTAKALGVKWHPEIAHNGNGASRITLNATDEFCGVIMPVRIADKARSAPDTSWVHR